MRMFSEKIALLRRSAHSPMSRVRRVETAYWFEHVWKKMLAKHLLEGQISNSQQMVDYMIDHLKLYCEQFSAQQVHQQLTDLHQREHSLPVLYCFDDHPLGSHLAWQKDDSCCFLVSFDPTYRQWTLLSWDQKERCPKQTPLLWNELHTLVDRHSGVIERATLQRQGSELVKLFEGRKSKL
jgi:hypothetical protein